MYVIDSQVHIWGAETAERPWPPGNRDHVQRPEPFGADELVAMMSEAGVNRAVLVPPSWEGDRNDLVLDAVQRYPGRFAVMGRLALEQPQSVRSLTTWKSQPGMLGVRLTFGRSPQKEWLFDGTADWFWPAAEQAGVPVMVWAPGSNAKIGEIAARHPALHLIIDHVGMRAEPDYGAVAEAVDAIVSLAQFANVAVKASALPVHAPESYPFPSLHDPIRRLVDAFGAERVFWGTDLTRLPCPYRDAVRLVTEALPGLSESEKQLVMGRALATWLDWEISDAPWSSR